MALWRSPAPGRTSRASSYRGWGRSTIGPLLDDPPVGLRPETWRALTEIAARLSTPRRRVSPGQVAASLIEDSVARLGEERGAGKRGARTKREGQPTE
jgi:hypothetical protein